MNKYIVTGAGGYIGSEVVKKLIFNGSFVYGLVRDKSKYDDSEYIKYYEFNDENDLALISNEISDKICGIFHFAWGGAYGESRCNYDTQVSNILIEQMVIKLAKNINATKIINCASIYEFEIYNEFINGMLAQSSVYSMTKFYSHLMMKQQSKNLGIQFTCGIVANTYGVNLNSERFIHNCIRQVKNNKSGDYSKATQIFDLVHIDDVVNAFLLICERGVDQNEYFIGNIDPKPLKYYIEKIKSSINKNFIVNYGTFETNLDINFDNFINRKKIFQELGYIETISFDEGLLYLMKGNT